MSNEPPPRFAEILRRFGLGDDDLAAWEESKLSASAFEDWLTDRVARRPEGRRAREIYGADDIHDFARHAILDALALEPEDRLLDVGCGGGLLLRDALALGAAVTGLDHSEEMVRLARERAPEAEVVLGSAERLPFGDASFTAIAMSIVFFFLPEPSAVLRECRRVLARGGRLAVYTTSPALRGTPAAPEPLASRGNFYEDEDLVELARRAGLAAVVVVNDDGGQLLTASV
jgi:SAM-dependent methyltransferase